jgi:2-polyprenyl-3-methyl-5-hydroxy-6-metoxy-1,4-benzoquinol methylase
MTQELDDKVTSLYRGLGIHARLYSTLRIKLLGMDYCRAYLPDTGTLIDVGCGYGLAANYLALSSSQNMVVGIDLNPKRIEIASKTINNRANISFFLKDAVAWAMQDCAGMIMTDFLHHVSYKDQGAILRSAFDNLKAGGVLLISEVDPTAIPIYRYWQSYLADRILYPFSKIYFRKPSEWEGILTNIGFTVLVHRPKQHVFAKVFYISRK